MASMLRNGFWARHGKAAHIDGGTFANALVLLARHYCSTESTVMKLSPTASLLRNTKNGAEIYVVGTAHISSKSAAEVREMIQVVRPESVMLELCSERLRKLRESGSATSGFLQAIMSQLGMPGTWQSKLVGAGLSGMYAVLKNFGLDPGAEFKAGIEEAGKIGARIVCGDQDQQITAQKISEHCTLLDILKMARGSATGTPELQEMLSKFSGGLEESVELMKHRESTRLISDYMRKVNPGIAKVLLDERNEILAASLLKLKGRGVGIVGLGHLDGIEDIWRAKMSSS